MAGSNLTCKITVYRLDHECVRQVPLFFVQMRRFVLQIVQKKWNTERGHSCRNASQEAEIPNAKIAKTVEQPSIYRGSRTRSL